MGNYLNLVTEKEFKIKILLVLIVISSSISCRKSIQIDPPIDQVITPTIFKSEKSATSAVVGIYSNIGRLNTDFLNGGLSVYAGLCSDEIGITVTSSSLLPFATNNIPVDNTVSMNSFWRSAYPKIYQANAILEGLKVSSALSQSLNNQLQGEAKFVRSLFYFYLVNLYGEVPLVVSTDYRVNAALPRAPIQEIYQQIISDLQDAQNLLPVSYPSGERARPNKWTATALLARVYLYEKNWPKAEEESTAIINSGVYSILNTLNTVFVKASNETIWQIMPVSTSYNTSEGNNFIPTSTTTKPTFILSSYLLGSFEPGDLRKSSWTGNTTISTPAPAVTYYYPAKYKIKSTPLGNEYNIVFRLAEQYLIRAEAKAQQNNLSSSIADLNVIRARAGLLNLSTSLTQGQTLAAVEKERRIELFAEWGHRWFDLKRTNKTDIVMVPVKGINWQSTDTLWPIPLAEINLNLNLTQNQGY